MCGIVGLFLKDARLEPELGRLMSGMLVSMSDRGPDSAGFVVYGTEVPGKIKLTLKAPASFDIESLVERLSGLAKQAIDYIKRGSHVVLSIPAAFEALARVEVARHQDVSVVGTGRRMEIFKDVGLPEAVAKQFELSKMCGTHGVGHTRMATESAVTTKGAHPFTTGQDQCLVHNGSLSNHNAVRRDLIREGITFETENDTEVAAGFMTWKMRTGASAHEAMVSSLSVLDGFYTFVIGTENGFGVLRDPIACKPAVMAETDRWVAFGTEYRALVDLPGIEFCESVGAGACKGLLLGSIAMNTVDLAQSPVRELNSSLHKLRADTNATHWRVLNPRGSHAIAAGLDAPILVEVEGNVGYYCAGMNKHARVMINGSAGPGVAENIMSGEVFVKGDASHAAGASGCGGLLVIEGNASARCGISMKGVDIVVKGSVGHLSAFMAQTGNLVVLGDAGEALGDLIYEARLYVRGEVKSLGADCVEKPIDDTHKAELKRLLDASGVGSGVDIGEFRRYGSARRLYHFHIDNAGSY